MDTTILIGESNPLFIGTAKQFTEIINQAIEDAFSRYMGGPVKQVEERHAEVNTIIVRKMLMEKGYSVKTKPALILLLSKHKVKATKKGRENWYQTSEINRIPPRR